MTALPAPDVGLQPWARAGSFPLADGVSAEVWTRGKLRVLRSIEPGPKSGLRLHVSVSHATRHKWPTWFELVRIRDVFMGDIEAYQVIPRRSEHTNVVDNCFHLWADITDLTYVTEDNDG